MENRIKDLELRCQNLPFIEKEKERLQDKEKHLNDAYKRLEQENTLLKKRIKEGGGSTSTTATLMAQNAPKVSNPGIFKKLQKATRNLGLVRFAAKESVGTANYSFRDKFEIYSLNSTINMLTDQIVTMKSRKNSEIMQKIRKDMPSFNQFIK